MSKTKKRIPANGDIDYGLLTGLAGYALRRAQAAVFSHFLNSVGKRGISPGQFGVLVLIKENEGLNQSALAKALGIERSTMVAVIDRLEGQGWVERVASQTDRRSYALALTAEGEGLLKEIIPLVRRHERAITGALSDDERAQLIDLLERVTAAANRGDQAS